MGYEIGTRLRKYREARNLSQKEFAKLIGVSNSRVSNWEQGINRPDVDLLATICEVLSVSPSDLLDIQIASELAISKHNDEQRQVDFLEVYDSLPSALQDYLFRTAKDLLLTHKLLNNE